MFWLALDNTEACSTGGSYDSQIPGAHRGYRWALDGMRTANC